MPESHNPDTLPGDPTSPYLPEFTGELAVQPEPQENPSGPLPVVAQPIVVPGAYQYLKRWTFVLVVAGVWLIAAPVGLALYYWWYHAFDKTPTVFVVLIFLAVCTVGGLLCAMVQNRPLVSAMSIGLMSAPLAATLAAAVLHGLYFCDRVSRCLVGLIPY